MGLSEPVAKLEKQPEPTSPISQEIKLMLGIPIIPDGTSVSITVKVESSPSGPIVSVGNPTPLAPATPQTPKPDEDAVIVDANSAINAEEVDEEFEIREPPLLSGIGGENLFENSKDSPFLASMITG